jgi:hypothetical protein
MLIHLHIACGCFSHKANLKSCDRDSVPYKVENIYCLVPDLSSYICIFEVLKNQIYFSFSVRNIKTRKSSPFSVIC